MQPTDHNLDTILALQLSVAWAGEGGCDPPRLGWWRTDLVDPDGGGFLLADLLPRTHRWAALQAVRRAAILVDGRARQRMAGGDRVRTLFSWGFHLDEKLEERLRAHKQSAAEPSAALPFPIALGARFDRDHLASVLAELGEPIAARVVPDGRWLDLIPATPVARAQALTRALLPLAESYPAPFYRLPDNNQEAR